MFRNWSFYRFAPICRQGQLLQIFTIWKLIGYHFWFRWRRTPIFPGCHHVSFQEPPQHKIVEPTAALAKLEFSFRGRNLLFAYLLHIHTYVLPLRILGSNGLGSRDCFFLRIFLEFKCFTFPATAGWIQWHFIWIRFYYSSKVSSTQGNP